MGIKIVQVIDNVPAVIYNSIGNAVRQCGLKRQKLQRAIKEQRVYHDSYWRHATPEECERYPHLHVKKNMLT